MILRKLFLSVAIMTSLCCIGCYSKWEDQHQEQQELQAKGVDLTMPVRKGDPSTCPIAQLGTLTLPQCCTMTNQCGGDGTMFGYGCSDFADPMFRAFLTNPPDPVPCGGAPGAPGAASVAGSAAPPTQPAKPVTMPPTATPGSNGSGGSSAPTVQPQPAATASGGSAAPSAAGAMAVGMPSGGAPSQQSSGGGAAPPAGAMPSGGTTTVVLDDRCPSFELFPGMTAMGCCTADNHCGADGSAMGYGCTDLANEMFRSLFPKTPPPQTCDGKPL
jgi:hypothetical protein